MDLQVNRTDNGVSVTLHADHDEARLLGNELEQLPESVVALFEVLIDLRGGDDVPLDRWREHLRALRRLDLWLAAPMRVAIREHAAAGGSYGDLARALRVSRSTAQYQRDQVMSEPPHPSEGAVRRIPPLPVPDEEARESPQVVNYAAPGSTVGIQATTVSGVDI